MIAPNNHEKVTSWPVGFTVKVHNDRCSLVRRVNDPVDGWGTQRYRHKPKSSGCVVNTCGIEETERATDGSYTGLHLQHIGNAVVISVGIQHFDHAGG